MNRLWEIQEMAKKHQDRDAEQFVAKNLEELKWFTKETPLLTWAELECKITLMEIALRTAYER